MANYDFRNPTSPLHTNHWGTPPELYQRLMDQHHFDYEACKYNSVIDDLTSEWGERTFCNPPYSNVEPFVKKAREEQLKGKFVVMLLPVRTSTHYFHKYILPHARIEYLEGRLKFTHLETNTIVGRAPFASCLALFYP